MSKKEKIIIRPEYSAVGAKNSNKPSRALQAAILTFRELKLSYIAEIGCGLLANTPHILGAFPSVILTDTNRQYTRIRDKLDHLSAIYPSFKSFIDTKSFQEKRMQLDGAIVINVLHVLPTSGERIKLLKAVYLNLRKKGFLFVDVPCNETFYRNIVKSAKSHNDGYVMHRGGYYTFYKNMAFEDLKSYVEKVGFQMERRIYLNHRVTFICQKQLDK